jgi:hypothetical protein
VSRKLNADDEGGVGRHRELTANPDPPATVKNLSLGHQACLGHGGGHTTWTCRTCDETVYGPQLNTHFLKAPLRLNFAWSPLPSFSLRSPTINPTVRMNDGFNYARPGV